MDLEKVIEIILKLHREVDERKIRKLIPDCMGKTSFEIQKFVRNLYFCENEYKVGLITGEIYILLNESE